MSEPTMSFEGTPLWPNSALNGYDAQTASEPADTAKTWADLSTSDTTATELQPGIEEPTADVAILDGEAAETPAPIEWVGESADNQAAEQKRLGWFRRNRLKLALGAAAVSTTASFLVDPMDTATTVKAKGAAVGIGMLASDAVWAASAAVMYRSAFGEWKNPLKISKDNLVEAASAYHENKVFRAAYRVNMLAATAFFAIPTAAVTTNLPPESWGVLTPSALEFSTTVALRLAINEKLKEHGQK
jgi:hypothetical protein